MRRSLYPLTVAALSSRSPFFVRWSEHKQLCAGLGLRRGGCRRRYLGGTVATVPPRVTIVLGAMVGVNVLGFLVTAILAHGVPEGGAGLSKVLSQVTKGGIMISQDILDLF